MENDKIVFKVAFVGKPDDKRICEAFEQWKTENKSKENNSEEVEPNIELVDISAMDLDEIASEGPFQGLIYYNDIHTDKNLSDKLEKIISLQQDTKDTTIFTLTKEAVTPKVIETEKERLESLYKKNPNIDSKDIDVSVNIAGIDLNQENEKFEHEVNSFFSGVVNPVAKMFDERTQDEELEVSVILDKLVDLVIDATEGKHEYTAGHITRVATYTEAIANKMGFSKEEVEKITISAKLHDIGKIVVRDSILAKPSDLNKDEKTEMGEHTEQGVGMLKAVISRSPKLSTIITKEVIEGVGNHHKEWDGLHNQRHLPKEKQNPDKTKGDDIGQYALTIAVADCLDAMTSQRAYNNPKHILDVFRDLSLNRGTQFKPEIAEALMMVLSEEIASLGIDPASLVTNEWIDKDEDKIYSDYEKGLKKADTGLKEFFEANKGKFSVNDKAENGAYSRLGFRLDDTGHLEFQGKYHPERDLNIPYQDKAIFKGKDMAKSKAEKKLIDDTIAKNDWIQQIIDDKIEEALVGQEDVPNFVKNGIISKVRKETLIKQGLLTEKNIEDVRKNSSISDLTSKEFQIAINSAKKVIMGDEEVGRASIGRAAQVPMVESKAKPIEELTVEQFCEKFEFDLADYQRPKEEQTRGLQDSILELVQEDKSINTDTHQKATGTITRELTQEQERAEIDPNEKNQDDDL